jgi:urea transport system permease protein
VAELGNANFREKEAIAERLVNTEHSSVRAVLTALLEDRLVQRTLDTQVFIVKSNDGSLATYELVDPVSLTDVEAVNPDQVQRIITNNRLRRTLRTTIARFSLSSTDASVRRGAVREMIRSLNAEDITLLRGLAEEELDTDVIYEIETALALIALDEEDARVRAEAVDKLKGRLHPEVRNRLAALLESDENGRFVEIDPAVRTAATEVVQRIDSLRTLYSIVETAFFGLSLGSVLVLIAMGLAITFGVMGVINMAHGELMMLGAYTTYVVQLLMPGYIDISLFVAVPAAFIVAGSAGVLLERTVIRFLYGRPLETLLATFGVSLILQQLVRSVFSANNRAVITPTWMSGALQFNEAFSFTYNRVYIVLFTLVVFALVMMVVKGTRLGLYIRAVSENRAMARAMGVRSGWVDAMTFGLGSGIAGVAGVALTQLTNVGPNLGQAYIVDSFMVVVFGGVGNLWGTLIGGMSLGIVNKLLEPFAGAVLGKILVLVILIIFIQFRPRGLFPQTGRASENE